MSNKLLLRFQKFSDKSIADLIALKSLSDAEFQRQYYSDKWNLSQLFDHLHDVEKASLAYMSKKSQASDLKRAGWRPWLYSFLLRRNLRSNRKFKAPSVLPQPIPTKTVDELLREFTDTRAKFNEFIRHWDGPKKKLLVFKHPRVGMLTLGQTLKFLIDHWHHHQGQLKELLNELNKEKNHVEGKKQTN